MAELSLKCNTCLAAFESLNMIKEHYRSDWHCFNSKRRAQSLPIVRRDQFIALAKAQMIKKPPTSSSAVKSAPVVKPNEQQTSPSKISPPSNQQPSSSSKADNVQDDKQPSEGEAKDEENDEEQENDEDAQEEVKLGPTVCIFDDKEFETANENAKYMFDKFGFFIPDVEYLSDLEGLLDYLNEKVKVGGTCLYCQKRFSSAKACQHHMIGKSHCKLTYEDDVDMDEYEDFYDFSSTYEDIDDDEIELDENGEIIPDEAEISHTGELVLPDGRILGHRDYRIYYKQRYRQEDTREPVLAQQREELLRYGIKFQDNTFSSTQIASMSEMELATHLIKYHKQIRKNQMLEQKGKLRYEAMNQRREYKSKIDKCRARQTTTDKIRDYHGILK